MERKIVFDLISRSCSRETIFLGRLFSETRESLFFFVFTYRQCFINCCIKSEVRFKFLVIFSSNIYQNNKIVSLKHIRQNIILKEIIALIKNFVSFLYLKIRITSTIITISVYFLMIARDEGEKKKKEKGKKSFSKNFKSFL